MFKFLAYQFIQEAGVSVSVTIDLQLVPEVSRPFRCDLLGTSLI
jgi:hypothetical protein